MIRPKCTICGKNKAQIKGKYKTGKIYYSKMCHSCKSKKYNMFKKKYIYKKFKKDICSLCGFIPVMKCQLDVHHVDNNNKNNSEENLITLCSNCHRLVHGTSLSKHMAGQEDHGDLPNSCESVKG